VAAVGGCGRGGVGGGGEEVIGRGVAAMERRRGLARFGFGSSARAGYGARLQHRVHSSRVFDRISLRMPLPGRAVLLAAAVESTPYLLFSSCPSPASPPRPVHHHGTTIMRRRPRDRKREASSHFSPNSTRLPSPASKGKGRARVPKSKPEVNQPPAVPAPSV